MIWHLWHLWLGRQLESLYLHDLRFDIKNWEFNIQKTPEKRSEHISNPNFPRRSWASPTEQTLRAAQLSTKPCRAKGAQDLTQVPVLRTKKSKFFGINFSK